MAYGAMSGGNLKAVDRVVKIVRELDRYHGFVAAERRSSASEPRLEASTQSPLALAAPPRACPEKAPQTAEMLENAPAPGSPEDNPSPRDADPEPSEASPARAATDDEVSVEAPPPGPQMAPEALDILASAPERGAAREGSNREGRGFVDAVADRVSRPPNSDPEGSRLQGPTIAPRPGQGSCHTADAPPTGPEKAPEALDILESAPERGAAREGSNREGRGFVDAVADRVSRPPSSDPEGSRQGPTIAPRPGQGACPTADAPPTGLQMAREALEIVKSAPERGAAREGSNREGRGFVDAVADRVSRAQRARLTGVGDRAAGAPRLERGRAREWRTRASPDPVREGAGVGPVRHALHRPGWRETRQCSGDAERGHGRMNGAGYPA